MPAVEDNENARSAPSAAFDPALTVSLRNVYRLFPGLELILYLHHPLKPHCSNGVYIVIVSSDEGDNVNVGDMHHFAPRMRLLHLLFFRVSPTSRKTAKNHS